MTKAFAIGLLLLFSTAFTWSQQPNGNPFLERLGLTEEEIEKVLDAR